MLKLEMAPFRKIRSNLNDLTTMDLTLTGLGYVSDLVDGLFENSSTNTRQLGAMKAVPKSPTLR